MNLAEMVLEDPGLAEGVSTLRRRPQVRLPILTAKIKLTWRCNLRCHWCGIKRRAEAYGPRELPTELVLETVEALARQGLRKLHLSGGEILLYHGLEKVLERASSLDLQVNLSTNGTLITKEWAKALVRWRIKAVNISVDSPKQAEHDHIRGVPGAWKAAWKGIKLLQEARAKRQRGPRIGINTLITRKTIKRLEPLHEILRRAGVDHWRLIGVDTEEPAVRPRRNQWEELPRLLDQAQGLISRPPVWMSPRSWPKYAKRGDYACGFYGENTCAAPWLQLFVDADGACSPCCMGATTLPSWGNLMHQPMETILDGETRKEMKQRFSAGRLPAPCHQCDDLLLENAILNRLWH